MSDAVTAVRSAAEVLAIIASVAPGQALSQADERKIAALSRPILACYHHIGVLQTAKVTERDWSGTAAAEAQQGAVLTLDWTGRGNSFFRTTLALARKADSYKAVVISDKSASTADRSCPLHGWSKAGG